MGLAGVAPAQAAIVAGWNQFNASTATYPKAANTVGANITATSQKPLRGKMKATTASLASQPIACGC